MQKLKRFMPELRRYGLALAIVAAATAVFIPGRQYFAEGQWALLYLLIIMFVARFSGVRVSLFAALLAFLCWNYFFLPPYHTFTVYDPKEWLFLIVFLVVGIIMGLQTGKLMERETQARARERETALLNRFSAHLVSELSLEDMAQTLFSETSEGTGAGCAVLFVPGKKGGLSEVSFRGETACSKDPEILLLAEWVYRESRAIGIPDTGPSPAAKPAGLPVSVSHSEAGFNEPRNDIILPLQTTSRLVGVLYVGGRTDGRLFSFPEMHFLAAVANQAAAFLERKQLQSFAVQADALQEADRMKSTFISSVSHELKTPLASITATITNILEGDVSWDEPTVRNELEAVKEDLDRLNSSISSLVDFSRLESAAWEQKMDFYELGEILGATLSRVPDKQRIRISFSLPDDLPALNVDFVQMSRVFQNLLENALIYSGRDSPVRMGASSTGSNVNIWVEDEGPGIPQEEREKIFEKFFRGTASPKMPFGTGLGLAIAAEIIKSHGGKIWVEDVAPHGAKMVISLPKEFKQIERT